MDTQSISEELESTPKTKERGIKDVQSTLNNILTLFHNDNACAAELLCDRHSPSKRAFRIIDAELNSSELRYDELKDESEKFASALVEMGVAPGDRVATLMGKSKELIVALMGIWRLGAVNVPLFTAFAPPAVAFRLEGSGAKVIICDENQVDKAKVALDKITQGRCLLVTLGNKTAEHISFQDLIETHKTGILPYRAGPDAPLIEMYTSGTTGTPKRVIVPVRALASFQAYMEFGFDIREDDVFWCAADPGWAYGLYYAVLGTLCSGCDSILLSAGFTPELTFNVLSKFKVTNFAAAPTVYRSMMSSETQIPKEIKVRVASSAGEPLTPDVNNWAKVNLRTLVHDHYGQSETGMTVNNHHHPALSEQVKSGAMGVSMPGWRAEVLKTEADEIAGIGEVGRLAINLPDSALAWFKGYQGSPKETAEKFSQDGQWYITGDIAYRDDDDFLHFLSRDDDVIIMAGYRIGPFEVESVLSEHPAIVESAAVARPDETRGEVLEAFVVLANDHRPSEGLITELQNHVKQNFAAHAYPRRIHFIDQMPKTPSGKIQRYLLREQLKSGEF